MLKILKKNSILYVEDEPQIQRNIAEYLETYFEKVYLASDGKEGLEMHDKYNPDVLLLDINLPLMDGLSLAKEVREKNNNVKIVIMSAYSEREKLLLATELKLTKYLIKPVANIEFKKTMKLLAKELQLNASYFIDLNDNYLWDKEREVLLYNGDVIKFREKEYRFFKLLLENRGQRVSYAEIISEVWSNETEVSLDAIKNQASKMRKKLPKDLIKSVYGLGYVLI